jgi:hypothetical protein
VPGLGPTLRPKARVLRASHAGPGSSAAAGGMPMSGLRPRQRMYAYGLPGPPLPSETKQMQTCLIRRDDGDVAEWSAGPLCLVRVRLTDMPHGAG